MAILLHGVNPDLVAVEGLQLRLTGKHLYGMLPRTSYPCNTRHDLLSLSDAFCFG